MKHTKHGLVTQRLENISKDVFKKYYDVITDLIGSSPGIYALYDDGELYYVGKSTDLRKRVKHHLRDRHYASWTHFSLYLVRKESHIRDIESLLIRIAHPMGNRVNPKGKSSSQFLNDLRDMIKVRQKEELVGLFGGGYERYGKNRKSKVVNKFLRSKRPDELKDLVSKRTKLIKTYKGKEYTATLLPTGVIKVGKQKYYSPTAAAKSIVRRKTVNGWRFWFIKDSNGEWIKLDKYRE